MSILINCSNCGKEIYKSPGFLKRSENLFCGNDCRVKFMKGRGTGESNPNFGKKWDDERKKKQSEIIKSKVDDEYRFNCSKGMKNRKVRQDTKDKRTKTMLEKYGCICLIKGRNHTEEAKEKIGKKSKEKFTEEFKKKHYKTMVERGVWIPKEKKNPYYFYRDLSNWDYNVLDFDVIGSELFKEFGYFNKNENKNGVVRDHRFSRYSGFENLVFPEILKHPFNCEFIHHGNNIRKHQNKKINSDSITIQDLFEGIKNYSKDYFNQSICLEKIKKYEMGLRYDPKDYL